MERTNRRSSLRPDQWRLSPAFDLSYAYNPGPGKWTATQQMSILGKREGIEKTDLIQFAQNQSLATKPKINSILDEVTEAIRSWPHFASQAQVSDANTQKINKLLNA